MGIARLRAVSFFLFWVTVYREHTWEGIRGVLPIMACTGRLRPKGGTFFQVLGIWKGRDFTSWGTCKGKEIWYSVYKGLKGQLKGMPLSKQGIWKGDHLLVESLGKGYLFCQKWYIKGQWVNFTFSLAERGSWEFVPLVTLDTYIFNFFRKVDSLTCQLNILEP